MTDVEKESYILGKLSDKEVALLSKSTFQLSEAERDGLQTEWAAYREALELIDYTNDFSRLHVALVEDNLIMIQGLKSASKAEAAYNKLMGVSVEA